MPCDQPKTSEPHLTTLAAPEDRSYSLNRGNLLGTLLAVGMILGASALWSVSRPGPHPLAELADASSIPVLIGVLVLLTLAHEALHALTWTALRRDGSHYRVEFGVQWHHLMPYAHPVGPMPAWINRVGGLAPALALGLLPLCYAFLAGDVIVAAWAMIMLASSAGDFLILWQMRGVPGQILVEDLSDRIGVVVHWEASSSRDQHE